MRHRQKKFKFAGGKDATNSILRKLATNLIVYGKIKTTVAKAKALKRFIDHLIAKSLSKTEASKNVLLKWLGKKEIVKKVFDKIVPLFSDRRSGFVRLKRLYKRQGDAAEIVQVEWVKPVENDKVNEKIKSKKIKRKKDDQSHQNNQTDKRKSNQT